MPRGWRPWGQRPRAARRWRHEPHPPGARPTPAAPPDRRLRPPARGASLRPRPVRESARPPKGTTSKTPAQPPDRLTQIVREEAARPITVREGDRTVTLSMQQAIIRRLFVDAVKGDPRARRHALEAVALSENEAPRTAEQPMPPFKIVIVDPEPRQPEKDRRPEDDPAAGA